MHGKHALVGAAAGAFVGIFLYGLAVAIFPSFSPAALVAQFNKPAGS